MRSVLALVLSGGGGERLSVLTAERAVSAVPFGGKYRIVDFVLSNCCHSGVQKVSV
ncbi:MAG TPA: sugar phosphate nucleotidyltransferase, partial [Dongiaceae bacterium]|nr:sugar phosphate nucleotidyltransferase [Dongiaceae bacterium]